MSGSSPPVVSFEDELLIVVDPDDRVLGHRAKSECHDGDGILHRAFSVFLFDRDGRALIQQRSPEKRLWPGFWANACCSHPRRGESRSDAAHRRTTEELGLEVPVLAHLYDFVYHARYGETGSEHELCTVFAGRTEGELRVNPREIAECRWVEPKELDRELVAHPHRYSPWLHLEWPRVRGEHWAEVEQVIDGR